MRAQLLGVGQVGKAPGRDRQREQVAPAELHCVPEHRDERHHPGTAAHAEDGSVAAPDEPPADRPAHLEGVSGPGHLGQVPRHLAVGQTLHEQLEQRIGGR